MKNILKKQELMEKVIENKQSVFIIIEVKFG